MVTRGPVASGGVTTLQTQASWHRAFPWKGRSGPTEATLVAISRGKGLSDQRRNGTLRAAFCGGERSRAPGDLPDALRSAEVAVEMVEVGAVGVDDVGVGAPVVDEKHDSTARGPGGVVAAPAGWADGVQVGAVGVGDVDLQRCADHGVAVCRRDH